VATCRQITNLALRKMGRLGAGRDARTVDATDALEALQSMYVSWIGSGASGRLCDITPTGTSYVARGNERIWRQDSTTLDVTLPELVSYEAKCDFGQERVGYYGTVVTIETIGGETVVTVDAAQPIAQYAVTPRDLSAVVISDAVGGVTSSWLYDGHIKKWEQIDQLQLDGESPRSTADREGLAALLALELADSYGVDIGPATVRQANRYSVAMTSRYGMRREATAGVYM
jgi:hypothetical protein